MKQLSKRDPLLQKLSDEELIASARMLVAQLSAIHMDLRIRGIHTCLPEYMDGEIRCEYKRVTEEYL